MKSNALRFLLPIVCLIGTALQAQEPATPRYYQRLTYVKVLPGKNAEYLQFSQDYSMKLAQARVNAGEILTWTLLRAAMPAGQEARADYIISEITEGIPREPSSASASLQKIGINISSSEYSQKLTRLATLVTYELWQIRARTGAPQKGHYIFVNSMKVRDAAAFTRFETDVQLPIFDARVKQGDLSGWLYATKVLPSGTEAPYQALTADMFPTWKSAFSAWSSSRDLFAKVHPGKDYNQTMGELNKLRDLARRELWMVVERVEKKT